VPEPEPPDEPRYRRTSGEGVDDDQEGEEAEHEDAGELDSPVDELEGGEASPDAIRRRARIPLSDRGARSSQAAASRCGSAPRLFRCPPARAHALTCSVVRFCHRLRAVRGAVWGRHPARQACVQSDAGTGRLLGPRGPRPWIPAARQYSACEGDPVETSSPRVRGSRAVAGVLAGRERVFDERASFLRTVRRDRQGQAARSEGG
jgi:hypothetical protein